MSDNFYASRPSSAGGGASASIHPSGGGSGPSTPRIAPSGGGVTSRPQKTEVLTHAQQSAIGGPGAPSPAPPSSASPHAGMPHAGLGPEIHPGIGEHQQGHDQGGRPPSARDERAHPDQFRDFDPRFDHDRDRLGNSYWRIAFSDYDRDRFLPIIGEDRLLYQIFGINYYPEFISQYPVPYYPTGCGPWNEGIWVIGADSRWWPVHRHQLSIIRRIDGLRGIGSYEPVIVPNCGIGPVATSYLI